MFLIKFFSKKRVDELPPADQVLVPCHLRDLEGTVGVNER